MTPLKRKVEDRSITALQSVIDAHPTMEGFFNKRDKELSWDGYIRLYQNDDSTSDKANYDDDVPVQIKGHVDKNQRFMDKVRITESVKLDDLNNYYRNRGCLYFVIYMNEEGSLVEIYYSSLFPSKIRVYLEEAKERGNTTSISIPFLKLEKDCKRLFLLCKQFSFEIRKQGSGLGQIVTRSIKKPEYVKRISATTIGGSTSFDLLRKINAGDTVIYGAIDDSGIEYPMLMQHIIASIKETRDTPVFVGEKQYYSSVEIETTVTSPDVKEYVHEGTTIIRFSPSINVKIQKTEVKINFQFNTEISQLSVDAAFVLDLLDKHELIIFGAKIPIGNPKADPVFIDQLKGIIEADETLHDAGCIITIPFKDLTREDKNQIDLLIAIRNGKVRFSTEKDSFIYIWALRGKKWPIIVEKSKENTKIIGFAFNTGVVFSLGCQEGKPDSEMLTDDAYIVPNYVYFEPDLLANLYYYDYEAMYEQIDRTVYNEHTSYELNGLALNLIAAYDLKKNIKLLEIAEEVLRRLEDSFPKDNVHYIINIGQIEVRKEGRLSDETRKKLEKSKIMIDALPEVTDTEQINIHKVFAYCVAVLNNDEESADRLYGVMTDADKTEIENWPIRALHLKQKTMKC